MDWQFGLLGVLVVFAISVPIITARIRGMQLSQAGFSNVSRWTHIDVVNHMTHLFGTLGYRVSPPNAEEDQFDLILTDGLQQKRAVLLRNWREIVDEDVVIKLASATAKLEKTAPMIITLESYTAKAREAAKKSGAILWTLSDLSQAIKQIKLVSNTAARLPGHSSPKKVHRTRTEEEDALFSPEESDDLSEHESHGAAASRPLRGSRRGGRNRRGSWNATDVTPRCPRCGRKMVTKTGDHGEFWGCPTFPRCLGSRPKS